MRRIISASLAVVVLLTVPAFGQARISLDSVDGLIGGDTLGTERDIKFYIRFTNLSGDVIKGSTNGFRVYSPDGATWEPLTYDTTGALSAAFYDQQFFNPFHVNGYGADTLGFGGFRLFSAGIPDGFDAVVLFIKTKLASTWSERTLCLDSAFYRPGGRWIWSVENAEDAHPAWDGPHCFPVKYHPTSVTATEVDSRPEAFELFQNHPNPFNPATRIKFALPRRSGYTLTVYNALGQQVSQFVGEHGPGEVDLQWDGADNAAGVYFYRLQVGDYSSVRKMVLVK